MIIMNGQIPAGLSPVGQEPVAAETESPSMLSRPGYYGRPNPGVLEEAFAAANDVANAMDYVMRPDYKPEPDHNPLDEIAGSHYETDYLDRFVDSRSKAETLSIMSRIAREERAGDTIRRAGAMGAIATLGAAAASPLSFAPVIGWYARAVQGSRLTRIGIRAAEGAVATGAAAGVQQAILQGAQETQTTYESLFNVAAGTLVGGAVGGLVGAVGGPSLKDLGRLANEGVPATAADERRLFDAALAEATDAGAAVTSRTRGSGELKSAMGLERVLGSRVVGDRTVIGQDPLLRLQTSPFKEARNTVRDLAETPLTLAENAEGIPTTIGGAVETRVKMAQADLALGLQDLDRQFSDYFFSGRRIAAPVQASVVRATGGGRGRMSYSEFKEAVWDALLDGDEHAIPQVAAAAKALRSRVFDPLKDEAIGVRLFPEDVKPEFDKGYVPRMYNTVAIAARQNEFVDVLTQWLASGQARVAQMAASLEKQADLKRFEIDQGKGRIEADLGRYRDRQAELRASRAAARDEAGDAGKGLREKSQRLAKEERSAERIKQKQYRDLLADLKRGRPAERYQDILGFVRSRGGIRLERNEATGRVKFTTAYGAELRDVLKGSKARGVLSPQGLDPDAMLRLAIDEGYLTPDADLNALVSAIDDTLKGNPVFSVFDAEAVQSAASIKSALTELERMGVKVDELTPEGLASLFGDVERGATPRMQKLAADIEELAERFDSATIKVEDIDRLADDLKDLAPELVESVRATKAAGRVAAGEPRGLERRIADARRYSDLSPQELRATAEEVTQTILGNSPARVIMPADIVAGPRGPLKERTLRIPTKLIRDFVERDPEVLARVYSRTMSTDINLVKQFGSTDLSEQIAKVNDEADRLIAAETDPDRIQALNAMRAAAIRDLGIIRDRLRGNYALPENVDGLLVRTGRVAKNLNYLRLLGGMTLSAIPDLARPVMIHGLTRSMGTAFTPFVKGLRTYKLAAREVKAAGTALDMVLDSRTMAIADVMEDYGRGSKFERFLSRSTRRFGIVSLMAPWNAAMKQFVGIVAQSRVLEDVGRYAKLPAKEREYLAAGGIDAGTAARIAEQFKAHGQTDGAIRWANTGAWTDPQARQALRAFLVRDVDKAIVTPGQDKPAWMSKELGSVVAQFKSYSMASTHRVMLSGLQQRDMATMNGVLLMLALGGMSYAVKQWIADQPIADPSTEDGLAKWAVESFDRSGLSGWIMEANNISEKLTRGRVGASALTGEMASRYASRNIAGALLGPTFDAGMDLAQVTGSASSAFAPWGNDDGKDGWKESDTRALRKLIPLQNLFYLRQGFNSIERGFNSAFGIPMKPRKPN